MKSTQKILSLLLVVAMIFSLAIPAFAEETETRATLVSWVGGTSLTNNGTADVLSGVTIGVGAVKAETNGVTLSNHDIATSTFGDLGATPWYGVNNFVDGTQYAYVKFDISTKGYENLKLEALLGGNTRVPTGYKLMYSLDNEKWTDVEGAVTANAKNTAEEAAANTVAIPAAAANQSKVYFRLAQTSSAAPNNKGNGTDAGALYIFSLAVTGTVKEGGELDGKTVVLHTNDVHGAIAGYAYVAALKAQFEAKGADVILVDAGDYSQGTTYVSDTKGADAIDLMNLVGYDFATIGNHEFDYGYAQLAANLENADFTVLCSDVLKADGSPIFGAGYAIKEIDGVKVGFFGLETPEAQTKANPALIKGLTFLTEKDDALWINAQAQVDALKDQGADVVICLSHLGIDAESVGHNANNLIAKVTGIDMVIDGHSHSVLTATAESPIQSTGTAIANIGVIVIDEETKAIEDNYLYAVPGELTADEDVAAAAQTIIDRITDKYGAVFAQSEVALNGAKAPNGNRDSETNLGDLICDSMVWQVMQDKDGLAVDEKNVVAITNGGGIRASIGVGDITMNDVHTVLPFGNTIALLYVTGAELLEALEASTFCTPTALGGFPQVSGIDFTVATYKAYAANEDTYPASTYYGPETIKRVTINSINGEKFDPTATYAVITNNFCAGGGDTYYAFAAASSQFDTGVPLDEALISYITEELGGVIGQQYAEPAGRIHFVTEGSMVGKTVVLHSNDVHGAIEGYAYMAALKAQYEEEGANVILVDAGDYSQGTTYVSDTKGADAIDLMNLVGYDFATIGNHEFDYGYAQLAANLENADFTVLCANVLKEDGSPIFGQGYAIKDIGGVKVGFFGLETPEAQTKANPALIKGLTFISEKEGALWTYAQAQVDALKDQGADVVICLSHLGIDGESVGHQSKDLVEKVTGIDMVIDGHSHSVLTATAESPIQSTGSAFKNVGVVVIDNETKAIEDNYLVAVPGTLTADKTVKAAAQTIIDRVNEMYGKVFAKSEVALNGEKAPGNRNQETNLGDLICDSMVWKVLQDKDGLTVPVENVVAITNGGGIRASIGVGDITMNDVHTVLPFGNTIALLYVTGAELLEALEASTYSTPGAVGGFPQVAGIDFTIATYKEYDANEETYPASTYYGPASIQRVTINSINGKAFDINATYAVITNNFCAGGGDTYYAFAAASSQFDTGVPLDEALMQYITEELGGVIGQQYAEPAGRITIKTEPDTFSDIANSGYKAEIEKAADYGIIAGYADGSFKPNQDVTRAQFVTMLWRVAGAPAAQNAKLTFKDSYMVAAPYQAAIAWAVEEGIIAGYEDGTFRPNQAITRAQMAVFMYRYLKNVESYDFGAAAKTFGDCAGLNAVYNQAISAVAGVGLMNGVGDGTNFAPNANASRGMAAAVLARLHDAINVDKGGPLV